MWTMQLNAMYVSNGWRMEQVNAKIRVSYEMTGKIASLQLIILFYLLILFYYRVCEDDDFKVK